MRARMKSIFVCLALDLALAPSALPPARAETAQAKIFHGTGKITGLDAAAGLALIDHENIPGLMDAMEMQYEVKPASLLDGLRKGDRVTFDVDGATLVIHAIAKVK